jgi:hypothetical protein
MWPGRIMWSMLVVYPCAATVYAVTQSEIAFGTALGTGLLCWGSAIALIKTGTAPKVIASLTSVVLLVFCLFTWRMLKFLHGS